MACAWRVHLHGVCMAWAWRVHGACMACGSVTVCASRQCRRTAILLPLRGCSFYSSGHWALLFLFSVASRKKGKVARRRGRARVARRARVAESRTPVSKTHSSQVEQSPGPGCLSPCCHRPAPRPHMLLCITPPHAVMPPRAPHVRRARLNPAQRERPTSGRTPLPLFLSSFVNPHTSSLHRCKDHNMRCSSTSR